MATLCGVQGDACTSTSSCVYIQKVMRARFLSSGGSSVCDVCRGGGCTDDTAAMRAHVVAEDPSDALWLSANNGGGELVVLASANTLALSVVADCALGQPRREDWAFGQAAAGAHRVAAAGRRATPLAGGRHWRRPTANAAFGRFGHCEHGAASHRRAAAAHG